MHATAAAGWAGPIGWLPMVTGQWGADSWESSRSSAAAVACMYNIYICINIYIYKCIYIYMNLYVCIYTYVDELVYSYVHLYLYVCI